MPTATGPIIAVVFTAALLGTTGVGGKAVIVAYNATVELTCTTSGHRTPDWYVNGSTVLTTGDRYRSTSSVDGSGNLTATLTIDGNHICGTINIHCEASGEQQLHRTTLTVRGHLPSPESVYIIKYFNTSIIEWKPPYSAMNNESDIISVDPHITQYTVYITTGKVTDKKNVTETQFTFNSLDYGSCSLYHVSAWNVGGEGEMSAPVCIPHIPCKVVAGNVVVQAAAQDLQIDLNVTEPCKMRIPSYFVITVMTTGKVAVNTTTVPHDPQVGSQVNIVIELPQNINMCSLLVNIRAGNGAGMSLPTEIEVECPTTSDSTEGTPTTSAITDTNTTNVTDGAQQAEDIPIVPISVGAVVAVLVITAAAGVAIGVVFALWKGNKKGKRSGENIGSSTTATANTSNAIVEIRSSGVVYTDVEALQRKIKPPPEDDSVQYQTVLPQPVIPDPTPPTLPPKSIQYSVIQMHQASMIHSVTLSQ